MYHFIPAEKDATLYQTEPKQNTGLDPILEVAAGKNLTNRKRSVLQFDIDELPVTSNYTAELLLKQTESQELKIDYVIKVHPITETWEMGFGRRDYEYSPYGVSWNFRNGEDGTLWSATGSAFNDSISGSQTFSYQSADVELDVTDLVTWWDVNNNNGLVVKFDAESNDIDFGTLKFFSKETHTIFQPYLRIGWDDQAFVTGSLESLDGFDNIRVQPMLKSSYKVDTVQRIRIKSREKYPPKSYDVSQFNTDFYLPENTKYRITDIVSKHDIIPYSDFSKVSCDENGNYFDLDFSNWNVDRVYEVEIKTERNGFKEVYKDKFIFTLIR